MIRAGRSFHALILAAGLVGGSTVAWPCGYEDPSSASSGRGILNFAYPDALHVSTAIWNAQQQSIIGRDERPAAIKALFGYHKAVERLGVFRDSLSAAADGGPAPAFSVVFIEPMLWTHYELTGVTLSMTPHVDGPANGDVVVVTDEPVVAALNEGQITPQAARQLDLMRIYGPPAAVQDMASWLDRRSPRANAKAAAVEDD
jgi:hypothetical protein